jgi:two-component system OmpR family response regulator
MPTRILAVEDEPDIATVLRLLFDPTRFHVMLAGDLDGARAILQRAPRPDLVLLNVVLPDGSGLDLCRELKRRPPAPPIVALTAAMDAVEEARGCVDLVVTKPFDPDALLAAVEGLVANGRANGHGTPGGRARAA